MSNLIMQKEIKDDVSSTLVVKDDLILFEEFKYIEQIYSAGIKQVKTKLEILDDEFHIKYKHNPIHHMEWRLKTPKSIYNKMAKRGIPINEEALMQNIQDVAGVRVICNYVKDIYRIADLLIKQDDVTLIVKKDYIKHPKENGYRSLHIVVAVPIFLAETTRLIPVEIQIRTIAMDFWASLEHHLRYKSNQEISSDIRDRLYKCAQSITDLDQEMESIHNELKSNQETSNEKM